MASKGKKISELTNADVIIPIPLHPQREIERGTELVFKCNFRETDEYVQSCYLDNRLGCWAALQLAETLENGIICFYNK